MRKNKFKPRFTPRKFYRINHFIQGNELRLLDEAGKQIGIVTKSQALQKAQELGVDVVEVNASAKPPVAKLISFAKFKYLQDKKQREDKKRQKSINLKEIRLRPFIGEHDFQVRVQQAQEFLKAGNQLKISVLFRGREITRKQFGFDIINRLINLLGDVKMIRQPHFEGKVLVTIVIFDKKPKSTKPVYEKNQGQN